MPIKDENPDLQGYKQIKDFEDYYINTEGRIYNKKRKEFKVVTGTNAGGYRIVILRNGNNEKISMYVHRLVALTFLDNPNNYETINHINHIKHDNRLENLEWVTMKENNYKKKGSIGPIVETTTNELFNHVGEAIDKFKLSKKSIYNSINNGTMCSRKYKFKKAKHIIVF
jgi:hypothetical protein